jgi:hypothetical protein
MYKHRTIAGIPAAEILRLRPGDILALTTTHAFSDDDMKHIAQQLRDIVPEGVKSVILDRDAKFQVIRPGKTDTET